MSDKSKREGKEKGVEEESSTANHVLFEMSGSIRKEWKYVRLVAKKELQNKNNLKSADASKAFCLICKDYITFSKGNGNSVYRHMARRHKSEMEKENADVVVHKAKKQKTEQNMREASLDDRLHGDALLVKWTSECLRPCKIVEDPAFIEYCQFLCQLRSRYSLPSRNKHRNQMMKVTEYVMQRVKHTVYNEMDYYSITTDIWSSHMMQSFMAVTLHYLTEEFVIKTFVLEVTPLRATHTGKFIAERLRHTLLSFGMQVHKITLLLSNNASNGIKACDELKVSHFGCIGHSLHLVVGPFLLETKIRSPQEESVDDNNTAYDSDDEDVAEYEFIEEDHTPEVVNLVCQIVSKFREIAKYIQNSPKAKEKIEQFDAMARSNTHNTLYISLDVRTRWNSTLEMLASMLKLKSAIMSFAHHLNTVDGKREFNYKNIPHILEQEWVLMEGLCLILQPFKRITLKLSGSKYPTISQALPNLLSLKTFLIKAQDELFTKETDVIPIKAFVEKYYNEEFFHDVIGNLKACCSVLLDRLRVQFSGMNNEILWITFLDPRTRKMKHLSDLERTCAKVKLVDEVVNLTWNMKTSSEIIELCDDYEDADPFLLGSGFDSTVKVPNAVDNANIDSDNLREMHVAAVKREIENYLEPQMYVSPKIEPLQWWRDNKSQFPRVAIAARKWLCVPATLTPSERIFSNCGIALSAKRTPTRGDALMNQILLKNNLSSAMCTVEDIKNALRPLA